MISCFMVVIQLFSQERIDITYNRSRNINFSELLEDVPEDKKKLIMASQELLEQHNVNFNLTGSNSYSDFRLSEQQAIATAQSKIKVSNETYANIYQKDFSDNQVKFLLHRFNKTYVVEDFFPKFDWKVKGEQKLILGYMCIKAVIDDYYGKKVEAWFAPKIPINNGPNEFSGLPGLILELTHGKSRYLAIQIGIEACIENNVNEKIVSKTQAITFNDYMTLIKKEDEKLKRFNTQW